MINIKIKEHKNGMYNIKYGAKYTNTLEHLFLIKKIIEEIEKHDTLLLDEIIELIKEIHDKNFEE